MTLLMRDQENQEIGEERGKEIGKKEIARAMLQQKEPLDKIVMYTGLSREEVERMAAGGSDRFLVE